MDHTPEFPGSLVAVAGPSGVGKTHIISALLTRWDSFYARPRSYTTRNRREGEETREYVFVSREWLLAQANEGHLANLDEAYGNLYAMARTDLEALLRRGMHAVKEIHPANIPTLRKQYPRLVAVLIRPIHSRQSDRLIPDDRRAADDAFYANLDISAFDVIVTATGSEPSEVLAEDVHVAVSAQLGPGRHFPHPALIDSINATGYALVAAEFTDDQRPTTSNFHEATYPFFERQIAAITSGSVCLEIGPGRGWLRSALIWPSVDYRAVDIARSMLDLIPSANIPSHCSSARNLPFGSRSFDFVLASLADGYCYPAALCEIRRVLNPSGTLVLTAPAVEWARGIRSGPHRDTTRFTLKSGSVVEVFSFTFMLEELLRLLKQCGFAIVSAERIYGRSISAHSTISEALSDSARAQDVSLDDLAIINALVATPTTLA